MSFSSLSKIRIAIVGTGFGQAIHLPAFKHHTRTEIAAVYHRDLDKAKAIADAHDIPFAANQLSEILTRSDVDAVSISTPPFLHYEMAKAAILAGKHVLLENRLLYLLKKPVNFIIWPKNTVLS